LRVSVAQRANPGHSEAPGTFARDTAALADIFSTLLRELYLVDAEEAYLVHKVHDSLVVSRAAGGGLSHVAAETFLRLIDQAKKALDTRLSRMQLLSGRQNASTGGSDATRGGNASQS